jgi:hypothetical protein
MGAFIFTIEMIKESRWTQSNSYVGLAENVFEKSRNRRGNGKGKSLGSTVEEASEYWPE